MALTVTTDLTVLSTAESVTGWVSYGSGGAGAMAIEPDFFVQGSNSISRGVSGTTRKGMCYGPFTAIDFTTGTHKDKLIYIWMRTSTPGLCDTRANGGQRIIVGSGATTPGDAAGVWSAWDVDGSDSIIATDGWVCYVIDPQSTASATFGGGVNTAAVTFIGGTQLSTTTAKGQNFGVDQIAYGRGELYVSGTVTTTGEGFKEIAAVAYDSARTNRWGIIQVRRGIIFVKGKIIIGHATSNTTFSSTGETVVFESPSYDNNTNVVQSIPDASVGGTTGVDGKTSYLGLAFQGGSGTTTISMGTIVGTDGGRSGTRFDVPVNADMTTPVNTLATITASDATMSLSLYATNFSGFRGQVDLTGTGIDDDDCFGCTFNACGRVDSNMEIRNTNFINSAASSTDGAYIWTSTTNLSACVFANNSRAIVFESSTGTPFTFTDMTFGGNTTDVRNESGGAITLNLFNTTNPITTENIDPLTLEILVQDPDKDPIQDAQTSIFLLNSPYTQLMNEDTDASGIASESYTGSVPVDVVVRVRKSDTSDVPRYVAFSTTQTITSAGLSLTVTLKPTTLPI
jgi:hypothetical protein